MLHWCPDHTRSPNSSETVLRLPTQTARPGSLQVRMHYCAHFDRTKATQSFLDGRLVFVLKTSSSKPLVVSQSLSSLICGRRNRHLLLTFAASPPCRATEVLMLGDAKVSDVSAPQCHKKKLSNQL